jgi:exopolyphosphatase/guanosine-5'-triphosphate,3'-diphosphate pyrophosphatase
MLYGIVDIGSNTVRLNVYSYENDKLNIIFTRKENLGLVFYIKKDKLNNEGIKKLVTLLKEIKADLDYLNVKCYSFFSTAPLRVIKNRAQVIQTIKDKVKIEVDVLSGEEEGKLSFYGSVSTIKKDDGILIDVGGGSVEIVFFKNKKIIKSYSIRAGSLKMYNEIVSLLIPTEKECKLIKNAVYSELDKINFELEEKIPFMCGVGGNIRAMGKILVDLNLIKSKKGLINIKLISKLKMKFKPEKKDTYTEILQVKPSRIHTFVPALIIVESISSYFGCEKLQISKYTVREGYLYEKLLKRC